MTIALAMAAMVYSSNELGDTTWQTRSSCSQPQIQYPLVKMNACKISPPPRSNGRINNDNVFMALNEDIYISGTYKANQEHTTARILLSR